MQSDYLEVNACQTLLNPVNFCPDFQQNYPQFMTNEATSSGKFEVI